MGLTTPRSLQNAAFFVVGKMFSLQGGVEHRKLKLSQLTRHYDPDHYIFMRKCLRPMMAPSRSCVSKGKLSPSTHAQKLVKGVQYTS